MKKDLETVRATARLAKLELADDELEQFSTEFARILEYFEQLNEVDTDDVEPSFHPSATQSTPLRQDQVRPSLDQAEALDNAPDSDGEHFKVPRVIE